MRASSVPGGGRSAGPPPSIDLLSSDEPTCWKVPIPPARAAAMWRHLLRLSLILLVTACSTMAGQRRGNSDVLSREEILTSSASTAYELIQQLRPQFLRSRGSLSVQDPDRKSTRLNSS